MKTINYKIYSFILVLFIIFHVDAQNNTQQDIQQVQPSIMVVPYVKEGEEIRSVLENDFNKRMAIAKVKEAFDKRNFTTKDFEQYLKNALKSMSLNSDKKTDERAMAAQLSGADIMVITEIKVQKSASGNSVKLILQAVDSYTGQSLANKTGDSGKFYTDDIPKLAEKAVESVIESFLDVMNQKFGEIVKNGRSIAIEIHISEDSEIEDFDSEIGADGDVLADIIEDWLDENAYKNNYHASSTDKIFIVDDFRIPLRDERGRNYKASKVYRQLRDFLKGYGLKIKRGEKTEAKFELFIM